ncbi:MAG: 1-(5-phosphoribosyl)-5-[Clostridia bacterium]|nr:1-(5-phosphoribosyl)-5-[(5-phosphoribosylamino)methylideneamino]imidazole-4-carboxamide isomerase [Clostridia bacterium]
MLIFPAIDLFDKKAVRLLHGDYNKMTVYSENPLDVAKDFEKQGAKCIHLVDLQGAKDGTTENLSVIKQIADNTSLFIEVGGGIRSMDVIDKYLSIGVDRVILGTAALTNPEFLNAAIEKYGEKIAVGVDIKDGKVAIRGWVEVTEINADDFLADLQKKGVKTVICTDISKDGAMQGTNRELYKKMSDSMNINIIASGGVSDLEDIISLRKLSLYGAIIGRAYYIGAINLSEAIEVAK